MRTTIAILVVIILGFSIFQIKDHESSSSAKPATSIKIAAMPSPTVCAGNILPQEVIVSITKQHMWACSDTAQVYDSPVVTGMENLPADLTPVGTYQIYAKETDLYLSGSDSTGSWNDYVNYWLPFLNNEYGTYGFHDATWRPNSAFGHIDPNSDQGSHGCVELPLTTASWLYKWATIGTTVVIQA
jgi:lipoprotein-anchoring transpeptidase ErfK/SrfK